MHTYKDLAETDIEAALTLYSAKLESYNTCAIHSRQCVEKYLKQIVAKSYMKLSIELSREEFTDLMNSHSLKRLLYYCTKITRLIRIVSDDIVLLNDYYTNVSYPGESYILVTKQLASGLLSAALKVREHCIKILDMEELFNER